MHISNVGYPYPVLPCSVAACILPRSRLVGELASYFIDVFYRRVEESTSSYNAVQLSKTRCHVRYHQIMRRHSHILPGVG